jgi:hypothetical protein
MIGDGILTDDLADGRRGDLGVPQIAGHPLRLDPFTSGTKLAAKKIRI